MCFSASASFGAGALLTGIYVASKRKTTSPSQTYFASIPLIFAAQQITEGFVWLSLTGSAYASMQQVTTYIFLFIAQVVWPIWVPYSILKLQQKEQRRRSEYILVAMGAVVSIYNSYCLLNFTVQAEVMEHHISYKQDYPAELLPYIGFLYIAATIFPPFLSRASGMWMLGTSVLISYLITTLFYVHATVSVWCFFASIISAAIYAIIDKMHNSNSVIVAAV
jgi:nitrate reductase NapE component